eukprot:365525-Chlamydomonas_euryale.AAC.8
MPMRVLVVPGGGRRFYARLEPTLACLPFWPPKAPTPFFLVNPVVLPHLSACRLGLLQRACLLLGVQRLRRAFRPAIVGAVRALASGKLLPWRHVRWLLGRPVV